MRLYLDEDLPPPIAQMLRDRGIDAVSAHEEGNIGLDDRAQLRHAIRERRMIATADLADFVALAQELVAANVSHAGMLLVPAAFRTSGGGALADAIEQVARQYPDGAPDSVLVLRRRS